MADGLGILSGPDPDIDPKDVGVTNGSSNLIVCVNCGQQFGTGLDMEGHATVTPSWHLDPDTLEYTCEATDRKILQ